MRMRQYAACNLDVAIERLARTLRQISKKPLFFLGCLVGSKRFYNLVHSKQDKSAGRVPSPACCFS